MHATTQTILALSSGLVLGLLTGCATSSPIERYAESKSHFSTPPKLLRNTYPQDDIYRIYQRAGTGFEAMQTVRNEVTKRAEAFAQQQGRSLVVLGEQISQPPYILGNFPRLELVFALIDKPITQLPQAPQADKYTQLEKLKALLDQGALTTEEFEREKAKLLK